MSTPILGLRTVINIVPDLDKAKEWYTKAFKEDPYFDEPFYVGFNIGGYEMGLLPQESPDSKPGENIRTYWGIETEEELNGEYHRLLELGATEHEQPQNVGGPIIVAAVKDPWGNVIGLICNPTFKLP